VFRAGNNTASATAEVTGMQKIVAASGTLHNVDPNTYGSWVSRVDTSVGSLSENKMAQHVQGVQILSGSYPKLFIADDGSFRAYGNLLTSLKRSVNTQELDGRVQRPQLRRRRREMRSSGIVTARSGACSLSPPTGCRSTGPPTGR
jgi:hypothetical protein